MIFKQFFPSGLYLLPVAFYFHYLSYCPWINNLSCTLIDQIRAHTHTHNSAIDMGLIKDKIVHVIVYLINSSFSNTLFCAQTVATCYRDAIVMKSIFDVIQLVSPFSVTNEKDAAAYDDLQIVFFFSNILIGWLLD